MMSIRSLLLASAAAACVSVACGSAPAADSSAVPSGTQPPSGATGSAGGQVAGKPTDPFTDRADHGRTRGDSTAPIWVVMASDFQCPFCKAWHDDNFARLVKDYVDTKKVRLAFVNFPLDKHKNAMLAAEAAMCAAAQDHFWVMHDSLFATQTKWEDEADPLARFTTMAATAGVDVVAWNSCVTKHTLRPLIEADRSRIGASGANATPTFFVGTRMLVGALPYDSMRVAIEAQLPKGR
jgi:protein-disulfide isomerase